MPCPRAPRAPPSRASSPRWSPRSPRREPRRARPRSRPRRGAPPAGPPATAATAARRSRRSARTRGRSSPRPARRPIPALCRSGPNGRPTVRDSTYTTMMMAFPAMPSDSHEPRRPPEQDRRPDQLRPGDHQEEDAVQGVFGEVLEHDREVDGRRADGQRRQAAEQIRPGCGRPGADLLVRGDRSAHTTNARLPVARPASATRPIRVGPGMYVWTRRGSRPGHRRVITFAVIRAASSDAR